MKSKKLKSYSEKTYSWSGGDTDPICWKLSFAHMKNYSKMNSSILPKSWKLNKAVIRSWSYEI